jgi:hypothetical protein
LARFSFLSSTHFSMAAMGLESDRIDATLQAAHEVPSNRKPLARWSATSASVLSLGGKAATMKQNRVSIGSRIGGGNGHLVGSRQGAPATADDMS